MVPAPQISNELKAPGEHLFAWLEVDGKKVEIYNMEVEGKLVSGWVESKVGSEVALCYRLGMGKPDYDINGWGEADGSKFRGSFTRTTAECFFAPVDSSDRVTSLSGARISPTQEKRLTFTPIEFTANQKLSLRNDAIVDGLGTIRLIIRSGMGGYYKVSWPKYPTGPINQSAIYLGSKSEFTGRNEMTERLKLGRTVPCKTSSHHHFDFLNGPEGLVCEFVFFYRSREILGKLGFTRAASVTPVALSRSVTPSTDAPKRNADSDSDSSSGSELDAGEESLHKRKRARPAPAELRRSQRISSRSASPAPEATSSSGRNTRSKKH